MDVVKYLFADNRNYLITLLAYIDPGTGSLAFQALVATLLSAGLFFKGLRQAIMRLAAVPFRWSRSGPRHLEGDQKEPMSPAASEPKHPQRKTA